MKETLYIGTSGWKYPWQDFYPPDLKSKDTLKHYAEQFKSTEINYSFYHLPKPTTYAAWFEQTPEDFIFSVKLSRFITHIKRLKDCEESLQIFLQNASTLKQKLGPILVQLPPNFKLDTIRLKEFLEMTDDVKKSLDLDTIRFVFEFRHLEWFVHSAERAEAVKILKEHNSAYVFGHSSKYPYPKDEPVTADIVYLRFHGPDKLFDSEYGAYGLAPWIPKLKKYLEQGISVYCYFNNTVQEYAVSDAKILLHALQ